MSRGLGVVQSEILAELYALPIEGWWRGIPLVKLAATLRADRRQVRRAVYALQDRGAVTVVKEPRVGRQGLSLIVWDAYTYEAWQRFLNGPYTPRSESEKWERQRREWLVARGWL